MPQIAQQDWIRINVDFENSFQGNSIRDESVAAAIGSEILHVVVAHGYACHVFFTCEMPDCDVLLHCSILRVF